MDEITAEVVPLPEQPGAVLPFCDVYCVERWGAPADGPVKSQRRHIRTIACLYCYQCGKRIGRLPHCRIHGSRCTDTAWSRTHEAWTTISLYAGLLATNHEPPPTPEDWAAFERLHSDALSPLALARQVYAERHQERR